MVKDNIKRKKDVLFRSLKRNRLILLLTFPLIFISLISWKRFSNDYSFEVAKNIDIFARILNELTISYVDEIDPDVLVKVSIDKMLNTLDPYTTYITQDKKADFEYIQTGLYGGIGASISHVNDKFIVSNIYVDKPAYKAGIKIGDELVKIDKEDLVDGQFNTLKVRNLLRGQPDTKIQITVKRYGQNSTKTYTVTREDIKIGNVPYYGYIKNNVGYISLTQFTKDATVQIKDAYLALKKEDQNLKGLILDLRNNPGGLLSEAIGVSNLFISKGEKIVETRGKMEGSYKKYDALSSPLDKQIPLVVLVNKRSASASEIVSGVIQDLDRGVVIGQQSFGKGLVQTPRELEYNTQLKLTTAKYYTPSGRCIQSIDYANKDETGKVNKTPDSLKQVFYTTNKRKVFDGGGITPDIETEENEYHTITNELLRKRLIFDFATEYYYTHENIMPPRDFQIDEETYNLFIQFVQNNNFESESNFKKDLETLDYEIKEESYYDDLKMAYSQLSDHIEELRKDDINAHKAEIIEWIKAEIVNRYYYRAGRIEATVLEDETVLKAVEVLSNPTEYNRILNP